MNLSSRAQNFLKKQEYRKDAVKSPEIIREAFAAIGMEPSPALMEFQQNYGGLIIYAGLEPICFGILHGEAVRGDFANPKRIIHQLIYHPAEGDQIQAHFTCADTRYQEYFTMDADGVYYEGWDPVARHFDHFVEDLAIFDEINALGYLHSCSEYFENIEIDFETIKTDLELWDYPDFPQGIIQWGQNAALTLRVSKDQITLYGKTGITETQKAYLRKITHKAPEMDILTSAGEPGKSIPAKPSVWGLIKSMFGA